MAPDVSAALAEAKALVASLESFDGSAAEHLDLLKQTDRVRSALEEPYDTATRWLENMSTAGALYVLVRIGAIGKIGSSPSGISAATLAKGCNADVSIITRAMRILVANGIGVEVGLDEYAPNNLCQMFQPLSLGSFVCVCVDFMRSWGALPDYVKTHEPHDLYDLKKSPFAFMAGHEGKTYYDVVGLDPQQRNLWNLTLQNMEKNFPIVDMFDFRTMREPVEREPDRPFIVDVGGGRGQALLAIREHCGGTFGGRLVLQDLPIVIDSLKEQQLGGIEPMKYDIFTPQPVKSTFLSFPFACISVLYSPNPHRHTPDAVRHVPYRIKRRTLTRCCADAHIYFMRRLLHDFYDPVCVTILRNTALAMGPTSRLLVCDMLVPDRVEVGGPMDLYWLDFSLLTVSGKERKMDEFKGVFEEAGLEVVGVYPSRIGRTVVVEGRLKGV